MYLMIVQLIFSCPSGKEELMEYTFHDYKKALASYEQNAAVIDKMEIDFNTERCLLVDVKAGKRKKPN